MKFRKKSLIYTPILKLSKKNSSILHRRQFHLYHSTNFKNCNNNFFKLSPIILGLLLILFGILNLIKNTVVYTPIFFGNSLSGGATFASSSIFFLLGIGIVFSNKKSFLGYLFITLGFSVIAISIFLSLKMRFLPTSLFNTLLIFSAIIGGSSLLIKSVIKLFKRRF